VCSGSLSRRGGWLHPPRLDSEPEHTGPGLGDDTLGQLAGPVGDIRPLAGGQPPDGGGMTPLGTGQHNDITGQLAGRGHEQRGPRVRAGGGGPLSGR